VIQKLFFKILILSLFVASHNVYGGYKNAILYYKNKQFNKAAFEFYKLISTRKKSLQTKRTLIESEYYLGKSLYSLGLYLSSAQTFSRMVNRGESRDNKYFSQGIDALVSLDNMVGLDERFLEELFQKEINESLIGDNSKGFYSYQKGISLFYKKKFSESINSFKRVKPSDKQYVKSLFFLGSISSVEGQSKNAINFFKKAKKESKGTSYGPWIQERSNLNIARTYFEMKKYSDAIKYYGRIPRSSPNFIEAVFESSWAFFMMEKPNNTLGNLFTIHSPFFKKRFYPESYLLQSLTYLRMCLYDRTRESLNIFKENYDPILKQLEGLVELGKKDSLDFYNLVVKHSKGKLKKFKKSHFLLTMLAETDYFKQSILTVENAKDELFAIKENFRSVKYKDFKKSLNNYINKLRKFTVKNNADNLVFILQSHLDSLNDLYDQAKMIEAEMMLGKIETLRKKLNIKTTSNKKVFIGGMEELKIDQKLEYWPFEGEYWEDELGGYIFNINSQCSK
tara:strand:+ start:103 stop:1629 length:1527 start_codon:yes stop_codon:yes gene_type:complete